MGKYDNNHRQDKIRGKTVHMTEKNRSPITQSTGDPSATSRINTAQEAAGLPTKATSGTMHIPPSTAPSMPPKNPSPYSLLSKSRSPQESPSLMSGPPSPKPPQQYRRQAWQQTHKRNVFKVQMKCFFYC